MKIDSIWKDPAGHTFIKANKGSLPSRQHNCVVLSGSVCFSSYVSENQIEHWQAIDESRLSPIQAHFVKQLREYGPLLLFKAGSTYVQYEGYKRTEVIALRVGADSVIMRDKETGKEFRITSAQRYAEKGGTVYKCKDQWKGSKEDDQC